MNNDEMNNDSNINPSLNNQNVINPDGNNSNPQEPVMQTSIPTMSESAIPEMNNSPIQSETPNSVSMMTDSQPQMTNSFTESVNTTIQPDISTISTPTPVVENNANVTEPKEKKSKNGILIAIIILLIALVAGAYVYLKFFGNISHKVYQTAVEKAIGNVFKSAHPDSAYQYEMALDVNVDAKDEVIPQQVRDLINNIRIKSVIQMDKNNHRVSVKLDSTYQNEALLNADIFTELDKNTIYVSLPGLLDKYIQAEETDLSSLSEMLDKKYDYDKIEKILKRELPKIIKEDECSNENGYYIWKVSSKDLISRFANLINTLRVDSEFVTAVGGQAEVEKMFGNELITTDDITESKDITFKLNEKEYEVSMDEYSIDGKIQDDTVTYNVRQSGTSMMDGSITIKGNDKERTVNLTVSSSQFGTVKANMSSKYTTISSVNDIDRTNVIKSEELTQEDSQALIEKLQESKLYELISLFAPQASQVEPTEMQGTEY